jgi:hypothetical protein
VLSCKKYQSNLGFIYLRHYKPQKQNMKKLAFVLAVAAVSFSSCKKTYTCTCTTSTTFGGVTTTTSVVKMIPDATQAQAATICVAGEQYTQGNSQVTTCKL